MRRTGFADDYTYMVINYPTSLPLHAGAHPTMRRAGSADDYTFMVKNAAGYMGSGYLWYNVKKPMDVCSYPIETD